MKHVLRGQAPTRLNIRYHRPDSFFPPYQPRSLYRSLTNVRSFFDSYAIDRCIYVYVYNIFLLFTRATGLKLNIHAFNFDFLPPPLFLSFSFIFPFVSRAKRDSGEFFTRMNEHRGHVIKKRTCAFYLFFYFIFYFLFLLTRSGIHLINLF